jgi:hypothetical protein
MLTKCRWVEAEIPALGLGTEDGGSQWCNRLPEVVMTSVTGFVLVRGVHQEEYDAAETEPERSAASRRTRRRPQSRRILWRVRKG